MRSPVIALALTIAVACSGYAFAETQPLTRADCGKAGMKWNDGANVCGGGAAAAATAAPAKGEVTEKKVVKKVKTSHGTKKTVVHKKTHHHAAPKKQGGFFKWLSGKTKKA